jgi:uncharacterized protein
VSPEPGSSTAVELTGGRLPGETILPVRVIPRARRSGLSGVRNGALLVRLSAAPVDGAANEALKTVLAGALGVPLRSVAIIGGERSREKRVRVSGLTPAALGDRLAAALAATESGR